MADFSALNQAIADLTTAVADEVANLDKLWTDFQNAMSGGADQATLDAAAKQIEDQITTLKADLASHTAP